MESSGFALLVIGMIWILNLGISFWNAKVTGTVWVESKSMGGFVRFMTWMGAIMAASGFSWCLLIFLVLGGHALAPQYVTEPVLKASFSLGYLLIVPAVLFSGLMIWIESLVQAWRQRDLPSMGVAAWNTFAQAYNTYEAIDGIPQAFSEVMSFFKSDSDDDDATSGAGLLVLALVALAIGGGIIITAAIIKKYAATASLGRPGLARA